MATKKKQPPKKPSSKPTPSRTFPGGGAGMKQAADYAKKHGEPSITFGLLGIGKGR